MTPTRPPRRPAPARTSAPIPSFAQVASALVLGTTAALGATTAMPANAAPPPGVKADGGHDGGAETPPGSDPELAKVRGTLRSVPEGGGTLIVRMDDTPPDVDPPQITIDGERIDLRELRDPIPLMPGEHRIVVTRAGSYPIMRTVQIAPGSSVQVALALAPVVGPPRDDVPLGGEPPRSFHHGGMCACDLPGAGTEGAPLEAIGAAALAALAACRPRRRKGSGGEPDR